MFGLKELLVILASYGLGCISTAYYLIYFRLGDDIRRYGSGNVGARNAGRVLGAWAFVAALLGDAAKGAAAVWLAFYFDLALWAVMLAALAVVAGHIWPVQLRFRGGKGLATALGTMLVFDLWFIFIVAAVAALAFVVLRRYTLSGLIGVISAPVVVLVLARPLPAVAGITILSLLILVTHRTNIRAIIAARQKRSETKIK